MSKGMFGPFSPVDNNRAYDLHGIWQPVSLESRGPGRINDAWFIPKLDTACSFPFPTTFLAKYSASGFASWASG